MNLIWSLSQSIQKKITNLFPPVTNENGTVAISSLEKAAWSICQSIHWIPIKISIPDLKFRTQTIDVFWGN